MQKQTQPFGHWQSPISAEAVAGGALRFGRVQVCGRNVYWSEGRPLEKGRTPIMSWTEEDGVAEILPAPYSARSRVHEYGGGEFLVADGKLFFVNDADQDVYEAGIELNADARGIRRLTRVPDTRFADLTWDARAKRLICVGETHAAGHRDLPQNALWTVPVDVGNGSTEPALLLGGHDFYTSPRLNAAGDCLAFLAWNLPAMPWNAAELFIAKVTQNGSLSDPVSLSGGKGSACFQPVWGRDGLLYFVWDIDGAGNLYRWSGEGKIEKLTDLDGELSMPLWSLNAASYALLPNDAVYLTFVSKGETRSAILNLPSRKIERLESAIANVFTLSSGEAGTALAATTEQEPLFIAIDKAAGAEPHQPAIIRRSSSLRIDSGIISSPRNLEFEGAHGLLYGLYYAPQHPSARGPAGALPPVIINLHGGPTSAAARGLKPRTLFFTSRGFAWLDLDYSGSTGYGRDYRNRLNGNWGVADVDDAVSAARFAASAGLADREAIFVTGGSAGGFTVLAAIAGSGVFRGAASYYGICDLVALQKTTHKFEQGYQSTLLGATLEENEAVYWERSAISHAGRITTPLILFQGSEDNVVPKAQSIEIAEALRANGVLVEYHEFAGEGHGFRSAETIRTCLELELTFYLKLMGNAQVAAVPKLAL